MYYDYVGRGIQSEFKISSNHIPENISNRPKSFFSLFIIFFDFGTLAVWSACISIQELWIIKYIDGISVLTGPEYKSTSCSNMSPKIESKPTKVQVTVMTRKHDLAGLWRLWGTGYPTYGVIRLRNTMLFLFSRKPGVRIGSRRHLKHL